MRSTRTSLDIYLIVCSYWSGTTAITALPRHLRLKWLVRHSPHVEQPWSWRGSCTRLSVQLFVLVALGQQRPRQTSANGWLQMVWESMQKNTFFVCFCYMHYMMGAPLASPQPIQEIYLPTSSGANLTTIWNTIWTSCAKGYVGEYMFI